SSRSLFPAPSAPSLYPLSLHDALPISFRHAGARRAAAALLAFLTLAAGSAAVWAQPESAPVIRIGSKNFTEQLLLGEIYALLLRSEEHTSELQSRENLVCRLLLEKKKK